MSYSWLPLALVIMQTQVTAYCLRGKTASGVPAGPGIAAHKSLPFGTKVRVRGKTYIVRDRCPRANTLDIWMPTRRECLAWGRRVEKVEITHRKGK